MMSIMGVIGGSSLTFSRFLLMFRIVCFRKRF